MSKSCTGWRTAAAAALLVLGLAACGGGIPDPRGPAGSGAASAGPLPPSPVASGAPASGPESTAATQSPPAATLVVAGGVPVDGELGTYTWDGAGSDAPWIVVPESGRVPGAATMEVRLDPAPAVTSWTARWALVTNGVAGPGQATASGSSGAIVIHLPNARGDLSLQVEIRAGTGRSATWYWRVSTGP